ncbi:hypothetical protein GCM10007989_02740 [Devosia pacifica]|uniref:Uncharacterized protein n=1 Tax=Devosia pacifica TaxID=1335967 RepID=A0A918RTQ2_9HYPH|nr:hypothetical protein [Devosia pacifica]GHA11850.1 hypothetical protein GCM10007989_02740 [Devosia pacifica]
MAWQSWTGQSNKEANAYRKNKEALGGARINQRNLDIAAQAGILGKDNSGNTVRRDSQITMDRNDNIVEVYRGTGAGTGGVRYVPEGLPPERGRPMDGADLLRPGVVYAGRGQPQIPGVERVPGTTRVRTAPVGGGAGNRVVTTNVTGRNKNKGVAPWPEMQTPPNEEFVMPDGPIEMESPTVMRGKPFPFGPFPFELNPYVPGGQVMEDELGESEFLNPTWFAQWGAALGHISWNVDRAKDFVGRTFIKDPIDTFIEGVPDMPGEPEHFSPISGWFLGQN